MKKDTNSFLGLPCITYGDIYTYHKTFIYEVCSFVENDKTCKDMVVSNHNDIIIPSTGETVNEISKCCSIKTKDIIIGSDIHLLSFSENFCNDFIALFLNKNWKLLSKLAKGSSIVHLYWNDFKKIQILCPKINEQQKIAEFFVILDKQIALWERKLQLNELILNKIGQLITKLIYTCDNVKLKKYLINENKNAIKDFIDTTPISISLWGKGFKKSNLVPKISNTGRPYYIRKINELIIGSQNFHNGSIAILDDQYHNPVMSNAILSFNIVNINPTLLEFILLLPKYQYYLKNRCDGTGQKEFSIKSILDLDFFKISPDLENNFVANIYAIKRNIKLMNKKILILIKKKSFYLHNLFL